MANEDSLLPSGNQGRSRLGRGLESLMGEYAAPRSESAGADSGQELPMEAIVANAGQPRRNMPEDELQELAQSIARCGVLQPILVRPDGEGRYQIVAGERRWRAAGLAGLRVIPALVRELDDMAVAEIGLIENIQREDLNPMEEAESYRQLMERFGHTQQAMAERIGKSRPHITNMLRLLKLPEPVQDMVRSGRLGAAHARAILSTPDPRRLAERIVKDGLSVRAAENLARTGDDKKSDATASRSENNADIKGLERSLRANSGLDLHIRNRGESGEVRVRYANMRELDDISRRLSGG